MREEVAAFIEARDGVGPADPEKIFLTDGASAGVTLEKVTEPSGAVIAMGSW